MADEGVTLNPSDIPRIGDAVDYVQRRSGRNERAPGRPYGRSGVPIVQGVRTDGLSTDSDISGTLYSGFILTYFDDTGYEDGEECWVQGVNPGATLEAQNWIARLKAIHTDGLAVYVPFAELGSNSCTPVVTAVACVNGQLAVTTQYITGDFVVSDEPCGGIGPPIKPALGGLGDPTDPVKPIGGGTNSLSTGGGGLDALLGGVTGGGTDPKDCMAQATADCMASYGYYNATCIQTMYWHCMGGMRFGGSMPGGVQSFNGIGPALGPPLGGGQAMPIDAGELAAALLTAGGVNVVASADLTGQTALGNILVYGTGTANGAYLITANLIVASGTGLNFTVQVSWTDEASVGQTVVISPAIVAAGAYALASVSLRAKASTNITVFTTGAAITISFVASAEVIQTR